MCTHHTGEPRRRHWWTLLVVVTLVCPLGCSKEQRQKVAATVNQKAQSIAKSTRDLTNRAVAKVEEQLPATGKVSLQMTPSVPPTAAASVEVIAIGDGRDNVLQIVSYDVNSSTTAYPRLMIRGKTQAGDAASLAGQTVPCEMYVRSSSTSPVAMTQAGSPAKITFGSFDPQNKTMSATIGSVSLIDSDSKPVSISGGTIVAVISNGGSGS